ncbi:hypothetical protein H9P43_007276 [Blastocladiella emersonii ATCC 22665]|nr:hypothetical protein H9P43_007276 [Blastocladiella emersonii ATCC 22665]
MEHYIGIDVGTSSARASVIDDAGRILATAVRAIAIHAPQTDYYEQSSADIWTQCCSAVRAAVADAKIDPSTVRGLGLDATCSLVALDADMQPVSVSPTDDDQWNIIMWMDHRAGAETQKINETGHPVLATTGGAISIEMQVPKLLWLQTHRRESTVARARHYFDLPDFLSWRATGCLDRSQCSLACKWTYVPEVSARGMGGREPGIQQDLFDMIGLTEITRESLVTDNTRAIGGAVGYLTPQAADELGLHTGVAVGVSMIDAYAGAIATLATDGPIEHNLALISGTSSCHIAVSRDPIPITGVWGPYEGVLLPGFFAMEGGQSASGKLIDHILDSHPAIAEARAAAKAKDLSVYAYLHSVLERLADEQGVPPEQLTTDIHVYPDFHGNRSPISDPSLRGIISGLSLDTSLPSLALLYLATLQSIALQTRHIVTAANTAGHSLTHLCLSGGLAHNHLYVQVHANATRMPFVCPRYPDAAVVLGAAVLGASAAGKYASLGDAMRALTKPGSVVYPATGEGVKGEEEGLTMFYERKYAVFQAMLEFQVMARKAMRGE